MALFPLIMGIKDSQSLNYKFRFSDFELDHIPTKIRLRVNISPNLKMSGIHERTIICLREIETSSPVNKSNQSALLTYKNTFYIRIKFLFTVVIISFFSLCASIGFDT